MSSPAPPCHFEDIVIDFAGRRLWRAGAEQPLEPKAFAVLALLAGEPGRVFTRDEILDAVWGHRHVTPGVLNRIVTLLRHALAEDAHHPRLLHTVHGVGYRLDLPTTDTGPAPPPAEEASPATADGGASIAVLQPRITAVTVPRRRAHAWRWLAAGLAGIVAAGAWWWPRESPRDMPSSPPSSSAATAPPATPTLVVMPLKPIGSGESVQVIAEGLGEELICSLAQVEGLRVIARDSTRLATDAAADPAALVQRLGITHALEGNLQQAGQSLRVRLRMVDAQGGGTLWTKDFDRDASEVLLLQRDIAETVAGSLALRLGLTDPPSRSGDAEFLRRYHIARALVSLRDLPPEASTERAEREFRALLRERPDDARAHAGLALALEVRAQRRPTLAATLREEAVREATLAQRLDATLAEPYYVLAANACIADDWERCLSLQERALLVNPSNAEMAYGMTLSLARLGYLHRAEARARELQARDPLGRNGSFMLARVLDTLGRHDEAHTLLEPLPAYAAYARWYNAVWRKDYRDALRIAKVEIAGPDHPDAHAKQLAPGYIAASEALIDPSRWPRAIAEFEAYEEKTGVANFSGVLAPGARANAAPLIEDLNQVRRRGYSTWDLLLWTEDLDYLRRDPAFQAFLRDNGILAYWRKHGFPPQCRARGDVVSCD
jgi:TolB-like protein/DNA-binding winged helix-turn-helix (wHTH) protein